MPEKINNLEELKREKELIKLKMKITQQAFFRSVDENRRQVQRLVINKIALPVGAGAIASWLTKFLAKKMKGEEAVTMETTLDETEDHRHWWLPIVRTVMRFLEAYLDQIDSPDREIHPDNGQAVNPVTRREVS